jgi:oxygen-independent coproporphyrinogen-3 oxidase
MAPLLGSLRDPAVLRRLQGGLELASRPLALGVLPHPFCNPAVKGCGFCTFPHEVFSIPQATAVVESVVAEIDASLQFAPELAHRTVPALYFGGGTANLSPVGAFQALCRKLRKSFDLSRAEVTLEGVPAYFVVRHPLLIDVLREEIPARRYRISMGIQTFDRQRLRQMGRTAFGDADTFEAVVRTARDRGVSVSCDLLFNLPGQSLAAMQEDLARALALGLDHICLYHLVLFEGLGTEWSTDPGLLSKLPDNDEACANWLSLRETLLGSGFRQTTLTNLEREALASTEDRFLYEELVLSPDRYDWLGFGPGAISVLLDAKLDRGLKLLNTETAADYIATVGTGAPSWSRYFSYGLRDLKVLYLTRKVARLGVDRREYAGLFGVDPVADFELEIAALAERGLLIIRDDTMELTPAGMFCADTIAGLLASRQVKHNRSMELARGTVPEPQAVYYGTLDNDARLQRMG